MQKRGKNAFALASYILTLVTSLFWLALRINHSGISKFLGADTNPSFIVMNLPLMVCVLCWLGFAAAFFGLVLRKRSLSLWGFVLGLITFIGALGVIYFGARDYMSFILPHFWVSLAAAAALNILALLLFGVWQPKKWAAWAMLLLAVVIAVVWGYELHPCRFTYGAVVYAVEDDYQIVFSTSDSAMAWVTIDGEDYYDLYAGSSRSADRVHKVTVPQEALDAAGAYTVSAQQMIYRGPFGGYKGRTMSRSYAFRPVNTADGLSYAALSDVHGAVDAAAKAAADSNMDMLILLGDLVSMVETERDAQLANELAHKITKGELPVIYARGNHEIKGEYAEVLYKYVGSLNQSFSYTVTLGDDIFAVVLDMGEDHEDDWWEYYGTAKFDLYRAEQSRMLEAVLAGGSHEDYEYRMALCHIPIAYIDEHGYFEPFRREWTGLVNELEADIALSGHEHRVWYFLPDSLVPGEELEFSPRYPHAEGKTPGGTVTDFSFPTFLCGQRSMAQTGGTQKYGMTDYLCLHVNADLEGGSQRGQYINSSGAAVTMEYPFLSEGLNSQSYTKIVTALR